jgi:hypothetical protein
VRTHHYDGQRSTFHPGVFCKSRILRLISLQSSLEEKKDQTRQNASTHRDADLALDWNRVLDVWVSCQHCDVREERVRPLQRTSSSPSSLMSLHTFGWAEVITFPAAAPPDASGWTRLFFVECANVATSLVGPAQAAESLPSASDLRLVAMGQMCCEERLQRGFA